MAYVSVPKDLNKIKSKIALNMTKRQLICFGTAAIIGIPMYLFTRNAIGNTPSVFLMMIVMSPLFFLGMYEKDGQLNEYCETIFALGFIGRGLDPTRQ